MSERLIPNGDWDFWNKANLFALQISKEPERFGVGAADVQAMVEAAQRFKASLLKVGRGNDHSRADTRIKDEARAVAVKVYKRCVDVIRLAKSEDASTLILAGLKPRAEKRKSRTCPQEPPYVQFIKALHGAHGALPMHELKFQALNSTATKPAGATRLELFVDLIGPDDPVPRYPGANDGGRPWYLRSFSRSPIRVMPPICRVPMLVVYWARWADAIGNVGPFSETVVSRIEGWSKHVSMYKPGSFKPEQVQVFDDPANLPTGQRKYSVEVLDAQFRALHGQGMIETKQPPQLAGPLSQSESEAA